MESTIVSPVVELTGTPSIRGSDRFCHRSPAGWAPGCPV